MWTKSIKLANKVIEADKNNKKAIFVRSLALIGKIE